MKAKQKRAGQGLNRRLAVECRSYGRWRHPPRAP